MSDSHRYRLESGTFRTQDGERHEPGAVLDLDPSTYATFSHKFSPVEEDSQEESGSSGDTGGGEAAEDAESDPAIPDDWDALRSMASAWDGDEISGRDNREEIEAFLADLSDTELLDLKHEAGVVGEE